MVKKLVKEEKERRQREGTVSGKRLDVGEPIPTKKKEEQVELVKLSREQMEKHLAKVDEFKNIPKEWRGKDLDVEASEKYGKAMVTTYKLPDGTTTTTKPEAAKGWKVMVETINVAFNPFSDKDNRVVATMGGKTFRSVAEFVGNHPYTTALILSGGFMLGTAVVSKAVAGAATKTAAAKFAALPFPQYQIGKSVVISQAGTASVRGIASTYAANTATRKLTGNLLMKAGFSLIAGFYIVEKIGATYPFAKFNISEALQGLGIARYTAFRAGDQDSIDQLNELQTEILNPVGWEAVISKLPWLNVQRSAAKIIQAQLKSTEVSNTLLEKAKTSEEKEKVYQNYAEKKSMEMGE